MQRIDGKKRDALRQLEQNAGTKTKKPNATALGLECMAEWTGLEPATPGVTGRYSNQLNYHSAVATC